MVNKDNHVTVWFIVERNTEIVSQNQCCQVPIMEGTGSLSSHLHNIYSGDSGNSSIRIGEIWSRSAPQPILLRGITEIGEAEALWKAESIINIVCVRERLRK